MAGSLVLAALFCVAVNAISAISAARGANPADATEAASAADPVKIFEANCALCHQKGAVGVHGEFPRLAGRIAPIASSDPGRRYLQQVVLFGMAGSIEVDGQTILGVMPSFTTLSNEDLAAVLNYLVQLGPASSKRTPPMIPFTAASLQALRDGPSLSPTQVHDSRARSVNRP